ncbi:peptidase inhibitor family I36 protein [Streptomyces sp. NPDC004647]|uniref:peptidase inhibitor family I36 protein n=1 Tax=Streptomyces sp. NPDC004647 TaxID=3154671 RepID=UPI0033BD87F9
MRHTVTAAALSATAVALVPGVATTASAGVATTAPRVSAPAPRLGACEPGRLCLWERADFRGAGRTYELSGTDIESCVPLPDGLSAGSLANRTGRPVTTYQSAECAETGEFDTYPGGGSWVPQSPYQVRAFKIWES